MGCWDGQQQNPEVKPWQRVRATEMGTALEQIRTSAPLLRAVRILNKCLGAGGASNNSA